MRGRVEEAVVHPFDKLFDSRARTCPRWNEQCRPSKRDVINVRARMAAHDRYLLDAQAWYMQVWDLIILLAMIWTVFVTPYEISFLPGADWSPPANLVITCIFAFDIVKEFFLPYRLSHKLGGGKVKITGPCRPLSSLLVCAGRLNPFPSILSSVRFKHRRVCQRALQSR